MKKLLLSLLIGLGLTAGVTYAANSIQYTPDLYPLSDSRYYSGTTTKAWLSVVSDEFCLTGDSCITSWLAGGGGGSTTTIAGLTPSNGVFVLATGTAQGIGLTITTTTPRTITLTPTVSSGYVIPLSASTTEWSTFYSTGTTGKVTRWISNTNLSTGVLLDNGTVSGVNATSSTANFNIQGTGALNPLNVASSSGSSLMIITPAGNVGIGTTGPASTLHVVGSGRYTTTLAVLGSQASSPGSGTFEAYGNGVIPVLLAQNTGARALGALESIVSLGAVNGTDVGTVLKINNNGTGPSLVVTSGNVGIGTTTPGQPLVVIGSSTFTSLTAGPVYSTALGGLYIGAAGGAGATTTITSNIQIDGPNFTFATGTMTGLNLNITGSGSTVTFSPVLQAGYVIPLSASTTEWHNFHTNVLSRLIIATGTTGTTFNVATTTNSITINCPAASGSASGCLSAADWTTFNNKLTTAITSLNGLTEATQTFATSTSGGLSLVIGSTGTTHTFTLQPAANYTVPLTASTTEWTTFYNTPSTRITAGTNLSWSTNTLSVISAPIFTGLTVNGGTLDASSTALYLPFSAAPNLNATSSVAIDSTSGQLRYNYGGATSTAVTMFSKSFMYASTTLDTYSKQFSTATTTWIIWNPPVSVTLQYYYCKSDTGTLAARVGNWTATTTLLSVTSTGASSTPSSNNTFTKEQNVVVEVGSASSTPNRVQCSFNFIPTPD